MPALTAAALRKQIASGETAPLYMLIGDDEVEKSAVAVEFFDMVDEGLRAFNVDRLYGGEAKIDDLVHATSTLPMMAPRRVVVILEAEKLLIPKRESKAAEVAKACQGWRHFCGNSRLVDHFLLEARAFPWKSFFALPRRRICKGWRTRGIKSVILKPAQ